MRPLWCPNCEGENVRVVHEEGDDAGDQAELVCDDCGNIEVITRLDLRDVFE